MTRTASGILVCGLGLAAATVVAMAAARTVPGPVMIEQGVDAATLEQYHHTDQGTRILPAAFFAALEMPDGSGKVMRPDNLRRWGFLVDGVVVNKLNPYGWPLGFTVSDPRTTGGVVIAGVTCALCHTGQIEYKGTAVRIEGGQSNINLPAFQGTVYAAFVATAKDPARRDAFLKDAVAAGYPAGRVQADFQAVVRTIGDLLYGQKGLSGPPAGAGRVDAVQGIANAVFANDLGVPSNAKNFTAPVNYPYLWDISRLTWVQYNGFLPPQADSRNIGEVIGTFGKLNLVNPATGALNPEPERWRTSIQIKNLIWMENVLKRLKAPAWPAQVLGPLDQAKAATGLQLFTKNCAGCHGIKELPTGAWDAPVIPLTHIGTDPNQATNWAGRTYDATKLGLGAAVSARALASAVNPIRRQLYADANVPASEQEGDVSFDTPCGYKARPLIGVWATPPFLHNGSVRTVFDLLSDTRPTSFRTGSWEYDPVKLGYTEDSSADPLVINTALSGNHNTGHWWTDDSTRAGRIGRKLSDDEKYAIIEYLKSATYDNYPRVKVAHMAPVACAGDSTWPRRTSGH